MAFKGSGGRGSGRGQVIRGESTALTGGGSGFIVRGGALVMKWGDPATRYDLKSTTKSIGITALGLAIGDGKLKLSDKVRNHHPQFGTPPEENATTGWLDEITLWHLATQTAGFEKPGGYGKLLFKPGTKWLYSDAGPNWIAECVTLAYRRDVDELMFERVFEPLGISRQDLVWRKNQYRSHTIEGIARREFGSGISANVDAMARVGYLYLRGGKWRDKQIIPRSSSRRCVRRNPKWWDWKSWTASITATRRTITAFCGGTMPMALCRACRATRIGRGDFTTV